MKDRIMDYLQHRLSAGERRDFEDELSRNQDLGTALSREREVFEALRHNQRKADRAVLARIETAASAGRPAKRLKLYGWMAAAAVVLVLLGLGYHNATSPMDFGETVALYGAPLENDFYIASRSGAGATQYHDAFVAYDLQDYVRAAPLLRELYTKQPDAEIAAYLMSAYIQTAAYDRAVSFYEKEDWQGEKAMSDIRWFAALAYLGVENVEDAKALLVTLKARDGARREESTRLLATLEKW